MFASTPCSVRPARMPFARMLNLLVAQIDTEQQKANRQCKKQQNPDDVHLKTPYEMCCLISRRLGDLSLFSKEIIEFLFELYFSRFSAGAKKSIIEEKSPKRLISTSQSAFVKRFRKRRGTIFFRISLPYKIGFAAFFVVANFEGFKLFGSVGLTAKNNCDNARPNHEKGPGRANDGRNFFWQPWQHHQYGGHQQHDHREHVNPTKTHGISPFGLPLLLISRHSKDFFSDLSRNLPNALFTFLYQL